MNHRLIPLLFILYSSYSVLASGLPGNAYFQQEANHEIHVRLDDVNHFLHARISTRYVNNSPDTLNEIFIHLWPNAYSSKQTAFAKQVLNYGNTKFHYAGQEEMGFIDSLDFRVDGNQVRWELDPLNPDIGKIILSNPLLPGHSIKISTPFRVKIPSARFSRLGHEEQAYYITQWYPKPAVYDQDGWHPMPYLNFGEYYSDFGTVDVYLTLPENYVVASTGKVMTPAEDQWLQNLSVANQHKEGGERLPSLLEFPASSENFKTIHLRQENVHDFAWFADKRFKVLRENIQLPGAESPVLVSAFFYSDPKAWSKVPSYTSGVLAYMSQMVSPYPWEGMSVVEGVGSAGAGMEYPAITLIGEAMTALTLERVVVHETIHNWFYGSLATNERSEPWLDEGLTTYYENRYMAMKYPDQKLLGNFAGTALSVFLGLQDINQRDYLQLWYLFRARANLDQPVDLHSEAFSALNYFSMTYYKAALSFMYLEEFLGTEVFDAAMVDFARQWNMKHPNAGHLRESLEKASGKDLDWFFNDLIATDLKIDYALLKVEPANDQFYRVEIENKGDLFVPFSLSAIRDGVVVHTQWQDPIEEYGSILFPKGNYDLLQINATGVMPEINRRNNNFWFGKTFARRNPMQMQLLGSIEDPEKDRIYYSPVMGYNQYDGVMAGMAFYNYVFPFRPTELFFMPLYGTANDRLAGIAWAYRSIFPNEGIVHSYRAGLEGQRYGLTQGTQGSSYNRLQASITATLEKPHTGNAPDRQLFIKSTLINRQFTVYDGGVPQAEDKTYLLNEAGFSWEQNRVLNPYSFGMNLEQGEGFAKLSGQAEYFLHYKALPKGISFRFFAGTFLKSPSGNSQVDYRFRLGGYRGTNDYGYETTFLGRSEPAGTFLGNQIIEQDGGFKYPTSVGQTWDWLMAVNLKADFPSLPLKAYFDAGTYAGASTAFNGSQTFSWVMGIQLVPIKNLLEINFPIAVSSDLQQVADFAFDNYFQRVTFSLHLDKANPFRYLRDLQMVLRNQF